MHINDSKNELGAHKDRHENIGKGYIGFDVLYAIVHHPKLEHVTKILERLHLWMEKLVIKKKSQHCAEIFFLIKIYQFLLLNELQSDLVESFQ